MNFIYTVRKRRRFDHMLRTILLFSFIPLVTLISIFIYSWDFLKSLFDTVSTSTVAIFFTILLIGVQYIFVVALLRTTLRRIEARTKMLQKERTLCAFTNETTVQNITTLYQEKLNQLYRFADFGRLSSGMFHDLMTPLSALIGNIAALEKSNVRYSDEIYTSLKKAVATSRLMKTTLERIRKQLQLDTSACFFRIDDEIREVLTVLGYRIRQSKVIVSYTPHVSVTYYGSQIKFHHIMVNLITNAIDACEHSNGMIHIGLYRRVNRITLIIRDTGCGIAPDLLEKIFDPFFTTKSTRGIGLGLSATRHAIEKEFGGTIRLKSTLSVGTTIVITIPLEHKASRTN